MQGEYYQFEDIEAGCAGMLVAASGRQLSDLLHVGQHISHQRRHGLFQYAEHWLKFT